MKARPGFSITSEDSGMPVDLALRSCQLRLLASLLGYPTQENFERARASLASCVEFVDNLPCDTRGELLALSEHLSHLERAEYETAYLRVFTHICSPDCNPCETSYVAKHIFQVSQRLSQITGFYRTFGLEVSGERPDHISVEVEFLGFLCYREAIETDAGSAEKANMMRSAQRRFIASHIGEWVCPLAALIRRRSGSGPMFALADLLEATLKSEALRLGAKLTAFDADTQVRNLAELSVAPDPRASAGAASGE